MFPAEASGPVSHPHAITPPQEDEPFKKVLNDAKTATTKAENSGKKSDINDANQKWAVVQGMVQYDYLLASLSEDPKKETQKLDEEYRPSFAGTARAPKSTTKSSPVVRMP